MPHYQTSYLFGADVTGGVKGACLGQQIAASLSVSQEDSAAQIPPPTLVCAEIPKIHIFGVFCNRSEHEIVLDYKTTSKITTIAVLKREISAAGKIGP